MHKRLVNWLSGLQPRQLMVLATSVALIVFAVAYTVLSHVGGTEETKKNSPAVNTKNVVVAKANISQKTILRREMLQVKALPENLVPANAVSSIDKLTNRMTKTAIFAGDVITEQKVYSAAEKGGFVGSIPPDCRAVSISINDITGVAGFAKPGDYVDVILVEKGEQTALSRILLQNVLLLSINDNIETHENVEENSEEGSEKNNNDDKNNNSNNNNNKNAKKNKKGKDAQNSSSPAIANPTIATLALKPDEVLQLISSSKLGEVYLMLRPDKPKDMYVADDKSALTTKKIVDPPKNSVQPPVNQVPQIPATNPENKKEVVPFQNENDNGKKYDPNKIEILYGDTDSESKSEAKKK